MTHRQSSTLARTKAIAQLVQSEVQYWCMGVTPEWYHWTKGNAWDVLDNDEKAAFHLAEYLRYADNAYVRGRLAYRHGRLGQWADASQQYERVNQKNPHPEFALGHARAELRLGNRARAEEILSAMRTIYPVLDLQYMEELAFLQEEIRHDGYSTSRIVG
jgi:tetratricopeptide (TPR) repeat protein